MLQAVSLFGCKCYLQLRSCQQIVCCAFVNGHTKPQKPRCRHSPVSTNHTHGVLTLCIACTANYNVSLLTDITPGTAKAHGTRCGFEISKAKWDPRWTSALPGHLRCINVGVEQGSCRLQACVCHTGLSTSKIMAHPDRRGIKTAL